MKGLWEFFLKVRIMERNLIEEETIKGAEVTVSLTSLLLNVVSLLYLVSPYDLMPESFLGSIGYVDDVLLLIVISIYNNPINLLNSFFGNKNKRTREVSINVNKLQAEDRLKKAMNQKGSASSKDEEQDYTSYDSASSSPAPSDQATIQESVYGSLASIMGKAKTSVMSSNEEDGKESTEEGKDEGKDEYEEEGSGY